MIFLLIAEVNLMFYLPDQKAICSWFPRASAWAAGGFNVRLWNQECEDFYLKRRSDILDRQAVPLSGNQWRNRLRMTQHAPKLVSQMNNAALSFLQSSQGDFLTSRAQHSSGLLQ
jgi:hypothetical protein